MKDDLIVKRAAKYRMGMTNQGGMGGVGGPCVEQSFEASGGAFEKHGSYGCGFGEHGVKDYTRARATRLSLRDCGCQAAVAVQLIGTGEAASPAVTLFALWICLLSRAG